MLRVDSLRSKVTYRTIMRAKSQAGSTKAFYLTINKYNKQRCSINPLPVLKLVYGKVNSILCINRTVEAGVLVASIVAL